MEAETRTAQADHTWAGRFAAYRVALSATARVTGRRLPGEAIEEPRGTGVRRVIGELITTATREDD
jgi:hypothetical protein